MKISCPNCGETQEIEPVAILNSEDKLALRISPKEGRRLSPLHVGGMMRSFERLLTAISKNAGLDALVLLQGLKMDKDGAVEVLASVVRRQREDKTETSIPAEKETVTK